MNRPGDSLPTQIPVAASARRRFLAALLLQGAWIVFLAAMALAA